MPGVILHAGQVLDEAGDPRQGPEIRPEAVRPRALAQGRCEAGQLLRREPRLASGPPCGAQRRAPAFAPRSIPPQDALATGAQPAGDGGLRLLAGGEEPCGQLPTTFQSLEIPSWGHVSAYASVIRSP